MPLEHWQKEIQPNTLYKIQMESISANQNLSPSWEVLGGSVKVYGTYDEQPSSPPDGMSVYLENFTGINSFGNIPLYIYLEGSPTKIILNHIKAEEVV